MPRGPILNKTALIELLSIKPQTVDNIIPLLGGSNSGWLLVLNEWERIGAVSRGTCSRPITWTLIDQSKIPCFGRKYPERDARILDLASQGKTRKEIAKATSLSYEMVAYTIAFYKKKNLLPFEVLRATKGRKKVVGAKALTLIPTPAREDALRELRRVIPNQYLGYFLRLQSKELDRFAMSELTAKVGEEANRVFSCEGESLALQRLEALEKFLLQDSEPLPDWSVVIAACKAIARKDLEAAEREADSHLIDEPRTERRVKRKDLLDLLAKGRQSAKDIASQVGLELYDTRKRLSALRHEGRVTSERDGNEIYYYLAVEKA